MEYHKEDRWLIDPKPRLIFAKKSWHARFSFWQVIVFFALCVFAAGMFGCDSHAQDAEIMRSAKDKAEALPPQAYFGFPIKYTATVTQCDEKHGCRTRYYSPRNINAD